MNKSSALLLLYFIISSCSRNNCQKEVDYDYYRKIEKCWNVDGTFSSFIVIREKNDKAYGFFLSGLCSPIISGVAIEFAYSQSIRAVRLSGDNGILKKGSLFDKDIENSSGPHTYYPLESDEVYIFSGSLLRDLNDKYSYYITSSSKFYPLNINFGKLILLSKCERYNLFHSKLL